MRTAPDRAIDAAGLLSQWRSYGRGGFAIEFDELEIDALNKEERDGWRYQGILTDVVLYEDHEIHVKPDQFKGMAGAFLRTLVDEARAPGSMLRRMRQPEIDKILGTAEVEEFAHPFLRIASLLKHSSFKEEAEYRIVALCNRPTKVEPGDTRKAKEIRFRSRSDGKAVPYVALYEGIQKPLPIESIIIGPHAQQEGQRAAVSLLLEQHQIDVPIRVSESPLRE